MATPTDDELWEIGRRAYGIRPADYKNKLEGLAAERRALYEAGYAAGYKQGVRDSHKVDVAWLLTDEAVDFWNEQTEDWYQPRKVLKALHDRITGGGQ